MRKVELILASFFAVIGIVTTIEAFRLGIGYEIWGPQAGFIIFWLSMLTLVCAGAIFAKGWLKMKADPFFMGREAMFSTGYVALTSLIFVSLIPLVGQYIAIFVYAGLFSAWLGKARWYSVAALSIIMPTVIFWTFEKGLMVPLIKSPAYVKGLLPF
jgi:hypothetical protein